MCILMVFFSFITYMFIFLINQSPYEIKYFVIHNKIFIEKKLKKKLCKLFSVNYRRKNCFIKDVSASLYHFQFLYFILFFSFFLYSYTIFIIFTSKYHILANYIHIFGEISKFFFSLF